MSDVIQFFTSIQIQLWSLIVSNWVLSISVLITVFGFIVDVVRLSRNSQ